MQTHPTSTILSYLPIQRETTLPSKQSRNTGLKETLSVPSVPIANTSGNKQQHINADFKNNHCFLLRSTVAVLMQVTVHMVNSNQRSYQYAHKDQKYITVFVSPAQTQTGLFIFVQ